MKDACLLFISSYQGIFVLRINRYMGGVKTDTFSSENKWTE